MPARPSDKDRMRVRTLVVGGKSLRHSEAEAHQNIKFRVFWDVLPCSQFDVDLRFRCTCCLHHQGDEP
jgi:hypothetical protein